MSVVCEAFGCVPSVAAREIEEHGDLVFDILELRNAASAFRAYQNLGRYDKKAQQALRADPLVQEVTRLDFEGEL